MLLYVIFGLVSQCFQVSECIDAEFQLFRSVLILLQPIGLFRMNEIDLLRVSHRCKFLEFLRLFVRNMLKGQFRTIVVLHRMMQVTLLIA